VTRFALKTVTCSDLEVARGRTTLPASSSGFDSDEDTDSDREVLTTMWRTCGAHAPTCLQGWNGRAGGCPYLLTAM